VPPVAEVPVAPNVPEVALTLGIDLRSGPRYPTGVAVMDAGRRLHHLATVRSDEEIFALVERVHPRLIAIDAPLALPEGRCCADPGCECARFGIMREVDRACAAAGYRPFATLLPSMVGLTLRGIALRERLTDAGYEIVEVYPGMSQDVLGIPRKRGGIEGLRRGLKRHGVLGIPRSRRVSHDEYDAITCALTAWFHLEDASELMGPGVPVPLVLPDRARAADRR
jgi:predicted nuclease with RNAse H fold